MRKGLVFFMLSLAVILAGCGGGPKPFTTSVIDLSHDTGTGYGFGDGPAAHLEIKRWQTFIATSYPVVTSIEVKIRKIGSGTYSAVRAELYETDASGKPDGDPLAYSLIPSGWIPAGEDFTVVETGLLYDGLEAGSQYAIVLTQEVLNNAHYEWFAHYKVDASLHFGKFINGAWEDESGIGDGWLKVHVASAVPVPGRIYLYPTIEHSSSLKGAYPDARTGADAIAAANRPLVMAGKICHAFISISAADCIANMPANYGFPTNIPIVSATDTTKVIADNWADLLDGTIDLTLNEAFGWTGPYGWWSGSKADGTYDTANTGGWTSYTYGMTGRTDVTTDAWIYNDGSPGANNHYVLGIAY
ncbi:MAG: hypothetical protein ACM3ZC_08920 [Bacteroidota bacterium]